VRGGLAFFAIPNPFGSRVLDYHKPNSTTFYFDKKVISGFLNQRGAFYIVPYESTTDFDTLAGNAMMISSTIASSRVHKRGMDAKS
jgi:hypothetical protein